MNPKFNPNFKFIENVPNIKKNMYLISNTGELYSLYKERMCGNSANAFIKPYIDRDGYERVGLMSESGTPKYYTKGVHTLVISSFKGSAPSYLKDPTVNHIDGNCRNNNINNLEWIERAANSNIQYRKHVARGKYNAGNIYSENTIKEIIDHRIKHPEIGCEKLHQKFKVSSSQIFRIISKRIWKFLTEDVIFEIASYFTDPKYYNWGYKNFTDEVSILDIDDSKKVKEESPDYVWFDNEYGVSDL